MSVIQRFVEYPTLVSNETRNVGKCRIVPRGASSVLAMLTPPTGSLLVGAVVERRRNPSW
jgi:hypothetical protein